jgi:single-stranded-DNA-specific exonuclease
VDARHPKLITAFGGHAMAAGLTLEATRLDTFREAFIESVEYFLEDRPLDNVIETDGELPVDDIDMTFAELLRSLGPWGQHFPEPIFEGRFVVEEQRVVGGHHLKLQLRPVGGHARIDAIAFGCLPEDLPQTDTVRLVYRLDINHFRGNRTCQLMVEHILTEND